MCSASNRKRNFDDRSKTRTRRSWLLQQDELITEGRENLDLDEEIEANESPVLLPLERYVIKQKETVQNVSFDLEKSTRDLQKFDEKVSRASSENMGRLSICGNCHLRIGHTKKICKLSPCRSAFSCGILSKHSKEKAQRTAIERDIARTQAKLDKVQKDVHDAKQAAEKLKTSVSKRIEDVVVAEQPDRYIMNGLRNWALLNKDVAILQKQLKGKLPARENVVKLLYEIIINAPNASSTNSQRCSCAATTASILAETCHRVSSQNRLLSENYAITFPKKRKQATTSNLSLHSTMKSNEFNDFKLALRLQQEEVESPPEITSLSATQVDEKSDAHACEPALDPVFTDPNIQEHETEAAGIDIEFEAHAAAALLQLQSTRDTKLSNS